MPCYRILHGAHLITLDCGCLHFYMGGGKVKERKALNCFLFCVRHAACIKDFRKI